MRRLLPVIAAIAQVSEAEIDPDLPLLRLGFDSLRAAELTGRVQETTSVPLAVDGPLEELSARALAAHIAAAIGPLARAPVPSAAPSPDPGQAAASAAGRRRPDLLERARAFTTAAELRRAGLLPYYVELSRNEGTTCRLDGRELLMLGSNNYLGLTADLRVRKAAAAAALVEGPSLTGSRLLNGSTSRHRALEETLAGFVGREDALVFTTGYQANLGLVSALLGPEASLVADEHCHASIYDGALVGRCRVVPFRHNDPADLERRLACEPLSPTLVIVDGVYSMEGDIAPLAAIRKVCDRHAVTLAVDDAHGLGMLGRTGRGSEEHAGVPGAADLLCGTFSKSLASVGGWVAGEAAAIDWIRFHGRSILFSAAIPPTALAAASTALAILQAESWRLARLADNARAWRLGLSALGLDTGASQTAIVPVHVGDDLLCMRFAKALLAEGVYVNCAVHPAVPRRRAMLRTSVMATHTRDDLERGLAAFARAGRLVGLI